MKRGLSRLALLAAGGGLLLSSALGVAAEGAAAAEVTDSGATSEKATLVAPATPEGKNTSQSSTGVANAEKGAADATGAAEITHPSVKFFDDMLVLTFDGYVAGTGSYERESHSHRQTRLFNSGNEFADSLKLGLNLSCKSVSAYVSFFAVPSREAGNIGVLDAFLTWKHEWREGYSAAVTVGKFTSYLGYEGFFPNERDFISYAPVAGIPGYQSGVRVEFVHGPLTLGAAVVDSLQEANGFYRGDGNLRNVGFELCASLKLLDEKLTIFGGVGADSDRHRRTEHGAVGREFDAATDFTVDLWVEYKATDQLTFAAEMAHAHRVSDFSWLAQVAWNFTDSISATVRGGGAEYKDGSHNYTVGVCPAWKPSPHFLARAEASCRFLPGGSRSWFLGAQAVVSF